MQFSSREARRSRSRAPGLLNDDSEEQPWPLGGAERRATAAPPSDGWSPAPPLVLVLVCVQARLSALAAAGVTCSSAHGDEKYVPQDTAVFCGILVLDWLGLSTSSTGRPPAGSSAHCCSPPDVEKCRLLLIAARLGRRCSTQARERTTGV
ncbi:uncharacterized protein LOC125534355 isoform X2 [Triticum urartu]|uniref:uncharacterized protein LOC125534355 isoform X2 n=1 Tax=Triticum urartu TaxID=4572 RepID=UPI002042CE33|nr:uncharacterized protein LOC125534355 isoform X2 [Triticum urartu]